MVVVPVPVALHGDVRWSGRTCLMVVEQEVEQEQVEEVGLVPRHDPRRSSFDSYEWVVVVVVLAEVGVAVFCDGE